MHVLAATVLVVATLGSVAQQPVVQPAAVKQSLAFQRAAHLKRGINLSMWYAQDHDLYNSTGGAEKLASYITATDFKLLHDLGCDHVRLSIDPEPLILNPQTATLNADAMARLDATVKQITATGLVVVLDIHPEEGWKIDSTTTDQGAAYFFAFWKSFAQHYAGTNPEQVYFEVLNEPDHVDAFRWDGEQARVIAVIRQQAPQHTIIATGQGYGGIDGLVQLEPVRDENVIYSFHDYEPMVFTHQGATWAGDALTPLRGVPYPSTPENVAPLVAALTQPYSQDELTDYGKKHWDQAVMAARIGQAVAWAKQRNVPLWCGEFGVYKAFAPVADRDRWIADMRQTLEADGIGWDMWDYRGGFALVSKQGDVPTVDAGVAAALGLGVK